MVDMFFRDDSVIGGMEPFVRRIVVGGLAVVVGLWVLAIVETGEAGWVVGVVLTLLGGTGLLWGIVEPLEG